MIIKISGAGSGKTTALAKRIVDRRKELPEDKMIYCVTYTNTAVDRISNLLSRCYDDIPNNIKVSTIHSFLYQEIIKPYYYLLYEKQYEGISDMKLDSNPKYRNLKIAELEKRNILHVSVFSTRAKWVVCKKSNDTSLRKKNRSIILHNLAQYCGQIFIDEAQDMNDDMAEIVEGLNSYNMSVELVGDPKQDVHSFKSLRKLVTNHLSDTSYVNKCYRCPQIHLNISNRLVPSSEKQVSSKTKGTLNLIFESEHNIHSLINREKFDLIYISKKNDKYDTHEIHGDNPSIKSLFYEIQQYLGNYVASENNNMLMAKQLAYYYSIKLLIKCKTTKNPALAIKILTNDYKINRVTYAKIIQILENIVDENVTNDKIYVQSIDKVKGQEGERCLFILTTDLAAYLFGKKTDDNKVKHQLYVALTRSLNELSILVSDGVERAYTKDFILDYFAKDLVQVQQ